MMMETIMSRSLRLMFSGTMALGIGMLAQPVLAQQATDASASAESAPVQRVEITGSSIKRLASENALPVTTVKADEFTKQGLTTAQEILNTIGSNQSFQGSSQAVGASTGGESQADLRGIGSDKTLVLLNGRRLAKHPYDGATVDLNIIPLAALDRVEILRDGASAIYGTDAIGGVINFITKRSVKGVEVTANGASPTAAGGGGDARANLLAGFGDFDTDGYNIFAVVDVHHQDALAAASRSFADTGVILNKGLNKTSGNTPIANYYDNGSGNSGNPSFASGCDPMNHSTPRASSGTCRYDYSSQVDAIPQTEQSSFFTKGRLKINEDTTASFEYLHSTSWNINRVAGAPLYDGEDAALTGFQLPTTSPFYPGGAGAGGVNAVPAIAGLTGPLSLSWRPLEAGKRTEKDTSKSDRFVAAIEGSFMGWDYNTGFTWSQGQASSRLTNGYVTDTGILSGVVNGILNPFGPQSAAGASYFNSIQLKGQTLGGLTTTSGIDFKASREFGEGLLSGGPIGFAIGGEFHRESASYDVNYAVATQAASTGLAGAQSISGARNVGALFTEIDAPITSKLDLQLAGRFDDYSDVGTTFNPKIGIRYQPTKQLLLRASADTGFRAPTLYEKNAPNTVGNSANAWDDPRLCPGGTPGVAGTGTAVAGANPNVVCNAQQNLQGGGNKNLQPEKAKNFSFGFVVEPIPQITASIDYWNIHITDSIGSLAESTIFGNPAKYSNLFVYNNPTNPTVLQYVVDTNANLGDVKTDGFDLSATFRLPKTSIGNFVASLDGTYVDRYEYQNEKDGPFTQNVGTYADGGPIFRWKQSASLQWTQGVWSAVLVNTYMTGYHDQNNVADQYKQQVPSYAVWGLSGTYTGFKNLSLTAGVKNLFNKEPPFTNQGTTFQQGYDPRFTDPLGRTLWLRGTYKFM